MKKNIELLAPAGNLESGIIAINSGADAVYIGAKKYGAREKAGNTLEDIEKLCAYAHKYWTKVYVTINTILYDRELTDALSLIKNLYEIGIDAIIIQDMGILELNMPPIPVIASTQMHNISIEKINFLEKVGFKRVILPRELSLSEITEISKNSCIELEVFIHGSLCVSYSGQCYLSYAIGGRSGNRGECAQPCRKSYNLMDSKNNKIMGNRHFLCLKDLNLSEYINELIDAGITSFKIEGRLKDSLYVKNIVSYYRKKIDAVLLQKSLKKSSSGKSFISFEPNPYKTFNRGYTQYFIQGRNLDIAALYSPKSIGEKIGKVKTISKDFFIIDSDIELHQGDGICFFDENTNLDGTLVNKSENKKIFPEKMKSIRPNTIIYRNHDNIFFKELKKSDINRNIEMHLTFAETENGFILKAMDEDSNKAELSISTEKIPSQSIDGSSSIKKQLSKLGNTDFVCSQIDINVLKSYFIKASLLNSLRRDLIEILIKEREKNRPKDVSYILKNDVPYPEKQISYLGNVLNKKAEEFYRRHGINEIEPAAESGIDMDGKKVMTSKYCLYYQLGVCLSETKDTKVNTPFYLVDESNRKFKVVANCKKCLMEIWA
ncbi:MAG: U32 family peptidase [Desulfobacterales bacterium]|nr:U32 family peptidase [Desulfobacterales bacterium]